MHCDSTGRFLLKEPAFPHGKPLYHRLPAMLQQPNETIWVVEGERCADKLAALGFIATTSSGVDSVSATDWTPLRHRSAAIWPGNDAAGVRYAQAVTQQLQALD